MKRMAEKLDENSLIEICERIGRIDASQARPYSVQKRTHEGWKNRFRSVNSFRGSRAINARPRIDTF